MNALQDVLDDLLFVRRRRGVHPIAALLQFTALVDEQRHVTAVVYHQLRAFVSRKRNGLEGQIPVFFQRLALPSEDRRAGRRDGSRSVVLSGENITRSPANIGAEFLEGLDQHRRLNRHVQRARDAHARERLLRSEFFADRDEAGHFMLSDRDLFAAPIG